jgi:hypothetical protein
MIDIHIKNNNLQASDTSIWKAKNILEIEIGFLFYASEFGIDYDLFFGEDLQIQKETFISYATSKLAENGVNPLEVISNEGTFDANLNINLN